MPGGEISIQVGIDPSGPWITFPITVGGIHTLSMVLDTGSPASVISPGARDHLLISGLLREASDGRYYRLTDLTVLGQPLPELEVRVLPRLTRLRIDGILGLDFLAGFEYIHFHVPTLRLALEDP